MHYQPVDSLKIWYFSFTLWRAWVYISFLDIKSRYSRTVLGPWWSSISLLIFTVAIGFVFSQVFGLSVQSYLPYVMTGLLAWGITASFITEGIGCFTQARSYLLNVSIPFPVFVLQLVTRQLIVFGQSLLIVLPVLLVFRVEITWSIMLLPAAILITLLAGVAVTTIVGGLCARHPDLGQFLPAVVQVCFLLTPVFWETDAVGSRTELFEINPFYYFVTLIRSPLLGETPDLSIWVVASTITSVLVIVALLASSDLNKKLSLWVS